MIAIQAKDLELSLYFVSAYHTQASFEAPPFTPNSRTPSKILRTQFTIVSPQRNNSVAWEDRIWMFQQS